MNKQAKRALKRTKTQDPRTHFWTKEDESEKQHEGKRDETKYANILGFYFMGNGSLNIF